MSSINIAIRNRLIMENIVGNTKPHTNTPDNYSNHNFKDIEEAIQKAIDIKTTKKSSKNNLYNNHNINNKN